jgi:hypothetical protein
MISKHTYQGDLIKVKKIDFVQFGDNFVVEVLKVEGAITKGVPPRTI